MRQNVFRLIYLLALSQICLTVIFGQTFTGEESITEIEKFAIESDHHWNKQSIETAVIQYLKAAEMWKAVNKNHNSAKCFLEAGRLNLVLGEKETAKKLFLKSLLISKNAKSHSVQSESLSELSLLSLESGNLQRASGEFESSLKLALQTDDGSAKAQALFSSAEYHYYNKNIPTAVGLYIEAINNWQKAGNVKGEAKGMLFLGYAYLFENEYLKGLDVLNRSLSKWIEINDKRGQAFTYIAIGNIYTTIDEKQEALKNYNLALSIFPDDLDFIEKARLHNGIGSVYEDFGEFELSLESRLKALELFQKENHVYGQLATLPSLASLSYLVGRNETALEYFKKSLALSKQLADDYYTAAILQDMGNFYLNEKNYALAKIYFLKSLSFLRKNSSKRLISRNFIKLARLYEVSNDFSTAEKYISDSLLLNKGIKDKFTEAETYFFLAGIQYKQNQISGALTSSKKSVDITESLSLNVLNTKLKRIFFSNVFERYELYINLLMKMHRQNPSGNYAVEALQAAEKSRARSMLENLSLSEANFTKDADVETVKREKEIRVLLNAKADKLTDLLSQNVDKAETEKISIEINELEHELEEIKANLKQSSPIYSAIKNPAPFDVGEFQKQILDENTLLLEFSFGKEESYLWLIGKTEVSSYILPPREQIEAKIQKLRELLALRERRNDEEIEAFQARIVQADNDYWQIAGQLSSELFGQVSDKFGKNRLIIVPDGKLNYFPVSALPLPNSESNEPILLSNEVIYEPSASTLSILSNSQNQSDVASKNLLVFSDPVFSKDDSRISAENKAEENSRTESASLENFRFVESLNSLARLTASKDEADSITDILGTSKADNYSGFSANREQLLNAKTADYKIIHFATHGLISEERPELSGIVLSRFDENGQKLNEFVRLQDIYGLNLNSDLVVLSACETGIGKEVRGEGLMSLNNAFLQVGAKSVMSSLWKVEDNATLELMKNFYASLADEKLTPSKALQEAQIKMWQSGRYKSPFYWGAFTVQGDFRRAPNLSRDFPYAIFLSVIGLAVLASGIFWIYRFRRGKPLLLNRK